MNGKLSTHVLDNYFGKPAEGIPWKLEVAGGGSEWSKISDGKTNQDGRTDVPLLEGDSLRTACYRITFKIAGYYESREVELASPPFLDEILITVNLVAGENYHVPLLMTPWSYSTYRGS
ncbi:hydroxyisourate hydrolase [Pelagicoccus sp. SDUM812002]|uniref:hydroxyisourate hydrolase n=1 Tax=Pelagicoccus sp. SDUM812002 TaxID=3041266 RepID=UPI00280C5DAB|nr:hydroxyisourate hydrolase [Pelagicoccus sp. SDUM812002]MDQ8187767.1 hydroxyisourate hydrolase [Pelagicoccus sp. SDUM812002]